MKIEQILEKLKYYEGTLPVKELQEAIKQKEKITPYLIEMLDYTMKHLDEIIKQDDDFFGYTYAIFLLAEFREKKLFPYLIQLMNKGESVIEYIIGDDFPEYLARLLASSYDEQNQELIKIIEDSNISEYIRSSALETYGILYLQNDLDKQFLITLLKDLINKRDNDCCILYDIIIDEITNLKLIELKDEAYKLKNNVKDDETFEEFEKIINSKDYHINRYTYPLFEHYEYIHDTIEIMDKWQIFCYKEDEEFQNSTNYLFLKKAINDRIEQSKIKLGRNDPCICGSGKKYKKCCLNKNTSSLEELNSIDYFVARAQWHILRNQDQKAFDCYRIAFFDIIAFCSKNNIKTIEEFDYHFISYDSLSNWLDDFLMLIGNNSDKINFQYEKLFICKTIEETFNLNQDNNEYWKEEIIRERANALFNIGKIDEATETIESYLKEKPLWLWGYIEMADWYYLDKSNNYNPEKAIEILERTLNLDINEDMDVVYERLIDLYKNINNKDKVKEYHDKLAKYEKKH